MTTVPERPDAPPRPPETGASTPPLESTLVRYDRRPDRRTVYPPCLSGVPRMSAWLTADAAAFVDLEAVR